MGPPDKKLHRLVMGTFAPAVDYLLTKRIREPLLGAKHINVHRFLKDFDYTEFKDLKLVDVPATG